LAEAKAVHPNAHLIEKLYSSLQVADANAAAACYASDAEFEDIAFRLKGKKDIRNMWRMVCHAEVTVVKFQAEFADDESGRGSWVAKYMFDKVESPPGRKVVSNICSEFVFRDGQILSHLDTCDPMRWAKQAYPFPKSLLVGRIAPLRRLGAKRKLDKFVRDHPG
jgi:ketosteroid isomerase-like protein